MQTVHNAVWMCCPDVEGIVSGLGMRKLGLNHGINTDACDVGLKLSASARSFSVKWGYCLLPFLLHKVVKLQRDDACESKLRMTGDCTDAHKLLLLLIIILISIFYSSQHFRIFAFWIV